MGDDGPQNAHVVVSAPAISEGTSTGQQTLAVSSSHANKGSFDTTEQQHSSDNTSKQPHSTLGSFPLGDEKTTANGSSSTSASDSTFKKPSSTPGAALLGDEKNTA